jgi:hypothetical protein
VLLGVSEGEKEQNKSKSVLENSAYKFPDIDERHPATHLRITINLKKNK